MNIHYLLTNANFHLFVKLFSGAGKDSQCFLQFMKKFKMPQECILSIHYIYNIQQNVSYEEHVLLGLNQIYY
jgi:hypothetical protein